MTIKSQEKRSRRYIGPGLVPKGEDIVWGTNNLTTLKKNQELLLLLPNVSKKTP